MYSIAALLYPNALATSVTLPMEILQAAGQIARVRSRTEQLRLLLAGPTQEPVTLFSGITLTPDLCYTELPRLDLLILPAIWRNPDAQLKSRHLITQSDNIYCVGSVNSIADLAVHFIEGWYGQEIARAVENQFSPEIRRPFSGAAYQTETRSAHHDEIIIEAEQWLQAHLSVKVSIAALASHLGFSPRTLNRRFCHATGHSPQAYLQRLRIAQSKELLHHSNLRISEVAWQVGLQDVSHFSRLFREHAGVTPLRYREGVRGKLFTQGGTLSKNTVCG